MKQMMTPMTSFFRHLRNIRRDERASDALPMRMVVAVIAIGALVVLLYASISLLLEKEEIHAVQTVISEIESHASQMSYGGEGSSVTMDVNIPDNTRLVMGAIPGKEDEWPSDARNYYIEINRKQMIGESDASYSNLMLNGCVVLEAGPHVLNLESVRDQNGKIFIALVDKSQS
ncbi:hypothetical protein [Methanolobus sp. WCC5]|jgi:hypothetical protein|uniref:hypothetical protein n=1 Tax=Methanolobus sp. WCC5 TaxID=3125785 RepID=UPI00324ABC16